MNANDRATIVTLLKAGTSTDAIQQHVSASVGEIAAIAEVEGLTKAHAKNTDTPLPDLDPHMVLALRALAWGENHHTARIRKLASRIAAGLTELAQLQRDAAQIEAAEREVAKLTQTLTQAQNKLRNLKTSGKTGPQAAAAAADVPDDKRQRDEIRSWAREQGMPVSQVGSISKQVMDAWRKHNTAAAVPDQRQAG
ncbi:Lsr2 family DNA-binding protein [Streptomyces lutosisoli]|uniref:Histone-like nucleoid-structuring protein Lsr2 n=1 Tax=Streptomyces lutosisoli TaxID=2665721 RepID=A0ABW2VVS1_9ACTN